MHVVCGLPFSIQYDGFLCDVVSAIMIHEHILTPVHVRYLFLDSESKSAHYWLL
jgi:hypothetical protein